MIDCNDRYRKKAFIEHSINPFSAELFKVDSSMLKLGRLYFHVIGFLEYFYNSQPNNADFRWDSSLRADSPESGLFATCSILPLALKELKSASISYVVLCNTYYMYIFYIIHFARNWELCHQWQWVYTISYMFIYTFIEMKDASWEESWSVNQLI